MTEQTQDQNYRMTENSKWDALAQTKEYKANYKIPEFTKLRVLKDALISLIPGSLPYNVFSIFRSLHKRNEKAVEIYDEKYPGVPTRNESFLERAFNGACEIGGLWPAYILESSIISHTLNLANGSDNVARDVNLLVGGYLLKTAVNCGLRYGKDYAKSHTRAVRSLEGDLEQEASMGLPFSI